MLSGLDGTVDNCIVCKSCISWSGIHNNACIHMEQKKSLCAHEFFWLADIQSTIFTMGLVWLLVDAWKLSYGGSYW